MRMSVAALAAFVSLQAGPVWAQAQADLAPRLNGAVQWCHAWADGRPLESFAPEILALGFADREDGSYGWDGGVPDEEFLRIEFWDIEGDRSCHVSVEPGDWNPVVLSRSVVNWAEARGGYVSIPAEPANPAGSMAHYRDGVRDFVIVTSPDGVGLAGYVMAVSLWTNMSPSQ